MDRQLQSPLLITPVEAPIRLTSSQTFAQLNTFLTTLPASPARTQLERLADALGVEIGAIAQSEGDRREAERRAAIAAARAEKRRREEEAKREKERADEAVINRMVEALDGNDGEEMEEGAVGFEGDEGMDDRGDVEYGDLPDEDEDEADQEKMDVEE